MAKKQSGQARARAAAGLTLPQWQLLQRIADVHRRGGHWLLTGGRTRHTIDALRRKKLVNAISGLAGCSAGLTFLGRMVAAGSQVLQERRAA